MSGKAFMFLPARDVPIVIGSMIAKADVRKKMRALLQLPAEERAQRSRQICDAIIGDEAWQQARIVGLFAPQATEPDVELLWDQAGAKTFCYPRVRDHELDFLRVVDRDALFAGRWNLREPLFDPDQIIDVAELDLLLIPGLAFTRTGERLGRGRGYYDRLLASRELRAVKIGVCFSAQLIDELPTESHDQRLDRVIVA